MQRPPITNSEILERELALSIVKRGTATKANELLVVCRRGLDADNFVLCLAIWTTEVCCVWHEAIMAACYGMSSKTMWHAFSMALLAGNGVDDEPNRAGAIEKPLVRVLLVQLQAALHVSR
jgi:hypothetical protein